MRIFAEMSRETAARLERRESAGEFLWSPVAPESPSQLLGWPLRFDETVPFGLVSISREEGEGPNRRTVRARSSRSRCCRVSREMPAPW